MNHLLETAQAISAFGFLCYGIACLIHPKMKEEFLRYGLPKLRVLTGSLQIAAAIALLAGYAYPYSAMLASLGLSLMMLIAIGVRLKIKDPFAGFFQAFSCFILNLFVFAGYVFLLIKNH